MEKRWVLKEQGDASEVAQLSNDLGIDKVLANLLIQRGVKNIRTSKILFSSLARNALRPLPYEGYGQGRGANSRSYCER